MAHILGDVANPTQDKRVAEFDQMMLIPKGTYVYGCDLDADEPTCSIRESNRAISADTERTVLVPKALAYFLSTHYCGSMKMRKKITDTAKRELRDEYQMAFKTLERLFKQ